MNAKPWVCGVLGTMLAFCQEQRGRRAVPGRECWGGPQAVLDALDSEVSTRLIHT